MLANSALDAQFTSILAGYPAAVRDPYPVFNAMREQAEIYEYLGSVPVVTTLAACRQVSMDDGRFLTHRGLDRFKVEDLSADEFAMAEAICAFEQLQLSGMNGETHKRARTVIQRGFGSPRAAQMEDYVFNLINEIADDLAVQNGPVDLMEMAYQVPLLAVMRMLGAPPEDMHMLKNWSDGIAGVKQFVGATLPPEKVRAAHDGIVNLKAYIDDMAATLRRTPDRSSLMGMLIDAEEGARLSSDELSTTFVMIFYAGHETTTNLLGNGFYELLRNRAEWRRLCEKPELVTGTVEEAMRYNPPVQMITRRTAIDVELAGTAIAADTNVIMLYGAANRDPAAFPDPEAFRIDRPNNRQIGLGHGVHVCLGAALARLEGRQAFDIMSKRFPDMEFAGDPDSFDWHPHAAFHGLRHLPVRLGRDRGRG